MAVFIDTMDKKDELCELLKEYRYVLHEKDDGEYKYLDADSMCITVLNAKGEEDIYIDLEEEFTISMNGYHCHFQPDEEDFEEMVQMLKDYLEGRCCVVLLFSNKPDGELQWRLSSTYEPNVCELLERKNVYNALDLGKDLRKELKRVGGKVCVCFFDSSKSKEMVIEKEFQKGEKSK